MTLLRSDVLSTASTISWLYRISRCKVDWGQNI